MKFDNVFLKKILVTGNYINEADFKKAEDACKKRRTPLLDYLLTEGFINKDILGQAIAESFGVPYADLNSNEPSNEQIFLIPEEIARKFRVVVFSVKKTVIVITTDDPQQKDLKSELEKVISKQKISLAFSLSEDIDMIFSRYEKTIETRISKIIKNGILVAPEILDAIFSDAINFRTSDIHFEPGTNDVLLRFRIDGVLKDIGRLPLEYYENVLNRIKVQSGIRIDEHYTTQDGAMRFQKDKMIIDIRVSIAPTVEGEKVVLRILNSYIEGLNLNDLGLSPQNQVILEKTTEKPFGMILVVGPTGSGKTTTLYALLKILNQSDVNITSIEDPVEYKMKGINQIQVNLTKNLTFAKGLRSIVRQDPDIILVGEIRDQETTEISVNAALTGHLLLSTFHANDAATAIPRLLDMNIEPFLLSSTLDLVIAQRLVRKICNNCRYSVSSLKSDIISKNNELDSFFSEKEITLYRGKGCNMCAYSGYNGRTAIFEIINITPEMKDLILKRPSTQEIWQLARNQGSLSLFEDGIEKVKNGITTLDELLRVAEPPKNK